MKKVVFLIFTLYSLSSFAQRPNRGGQRNNLVKQERAPKFDAVKRAGIFYYNIENVIKKVTGKKNPQNEKITTTLKEYNKKVKEIASLNSKKLSDLNAIVNSMSKGNVGNRKGMIKRVNEVVRPLREQIRSNEKILNDSFEELLSEKLNKKWLKYQNKKKKSLEPKRPNRRNEANSNQGRGGQRRQ